MFFKKHHFISGTLGEILSGGRTEAYEDIDRSNRPTTTAGQNMGGYDFATAQQI